jgi:hypothetical protein
VSMSCRWVASTWRVVDQAPPPAPAPPPPPWLLLLGLLSGVTPGPGSGVGGWCVVCSVWASAPCLYMQRTHAVHFHVWLSGNACISGEHCRGGVGGCVCQPAGHMVVVEGWLHQRWTLEG